jgi:hypothetical protein
VNFPIFHLLTLLLIISKAHAVYFSGIALLHPACIGGQPHLLALPQAMPAMGLIGRAEGVKEWHRAMTALHVGQDHDIQ